MRLSICITGELFPLVTAGKWLDSVSSTIALYVLNMASRSLMFVLTPSGNLFFQSIFGGLLCLYDGDSKD